MIYLLDTSALVGLLRDRKLQEAWYDAIDAEAIGTCYPQLARAGHHRRASPGDLIIAATAAYHGLTVLHDDDDYRTVARHAPDLTEHNIHDIS